jgi:hypothetical protein
LGKQSSAVRDETQGPAPDRRSRSDRRIGLDRRRIEFRSHLAVGDADRRAQVRRNNDRQQRGVPLARWLRRVLRVGTSNEPA